MTKAKAKSRASKEAARYEWVRKWGEMMGSDRDYIVRQQERAAECGAPLDAIYEHCDPGGRPNGEWAVVSQVTNPSTRYRLGLT